MDSVDIDLKQEVTKWQCPHELGGKSGSSLGINKAVKMTRGAKVSPGSGTGEGGCHRTGKGSQVASGHHYGQLKGEFWSKKGGGLERPPRVCLGRFLGRSDVQKRRKVAPAPEESATSLSSSLGSQSWEAGRRDLKQKGPCCSLTQSLTFCNRKRSIEVLSSSLVFIN